MEEKLLYIASWLTMNKNDIILFEWKFYLAEVILPLALACYLYIWNTPLLYKQKPVVQGRGRIAE